MLKQLKLSPCFNGNNDMTILTQHPELQCLNPQEEFSKRFSFCTLVTRYDEYLEMVESAKQAGFAGSDVEFLYFDNKQSNQYDGYSGINKAIRAARGKYLIFCHQDILFKFDGRTILDQRIEELEQLDPNWAVAGNAGKTRSGEVKLRITDPYGKDIKKGLFPAEVNSLDENILIINLSQNIACTANMTGFHLYGTDLCQNSYQLGLKSYVIDFHIFHKSAGKVDQSYFYAQKAYAEVQYHRKQGQFVWAMCSGFFVSHSRLKNWLFSRKWLLSLIKSYYTRG